MDFILLLFYSFFFCSKITLASTNAPSLHNFLSRHSLQEISGISPSRRSRVFDPSHSAIYSSLSRSPPTSPSRHRPQTSPPSPPRSPPSLPHLGFNSRIAPVRVPFSRLPQRLALRRNSRFLAHENLLTSLTRTRTQRTDARADPHEADAGHASLVQRAQRRAALGKAWVTWCRAMYWRYCEEMGGIFREVSVLTKCMAVWKRHFEDQKRKAVIAENFHRFLPSFFYTPNANFILFYFSNQRNKLLAKSIRMWKRRTRESLAVWKRGIILRWRKFVEISKAKKRRLRLANDFARVVSKQNAVKVNILPLN